MLAQKIRPLSTPLDMNEIMSDAKSHTRQLLDNLRLGNCGEFSHVIIDQLSKLHGNTPRAPVRYLPRRLCAYRLVILDDGEFGVFQQAYMNIIINYIPCYHKLDCHFDLEAGHANKHNGIPGFFNRQGSQSPISLDTPEFKM